MWPLCSCGFSLPPPTLLPRYCPGFCLVVYFSFILWITDIKVEMIFALKQIFFNLTRKSLAIRFLWRCSSKRSIAFLWPENLGLASWQRFLCWGKWVSQCWRQPPPPPTRPSPPPYPGTSPSPLPLSSISSSLRELGRALSSSYILHLTKEGHCQQHHDIFYVPWPRRSREGKRVSPCCM